jgi:hypothetical protein
MTSSPLSPIRAVLFVPSEAHREALLADGVCGARVPSAYWHRGGIEAIPEPGWRANPAHLPPGNALVLAFDGRVVREGRDRAAYVLAEAVGQDASGGVCWYESVGDFSLATPSDGGERFGAPGSPAGLPDDLRTAWALAVVCAARGLGRVDVVRG